MRVIPEYEPVGRRCLSFVEEFFNSRFRYGRAIAAMTKAALDLVEVEIFVSPGDRPILEGELRAASEASWAASVSARPPSCPGAAEAGLAPWLHTPTLTYPATRCRTR